MRQYLEKYMLQIRDTTFWDLILSSHGVSLASNLFFSAMQYPDSKLRVPLETKPKK